MRSEPFRCGGILFAYRTGYHRTAFLSRSPYECRDHPNFDQSVQSRDDQSADSEICAYFQLFSKLFGLSFGFGGKLNDQVLMYISYQPLRRRRQYKFKFFMIDREPSMRNSMFEVRKIGTLVGTGFRRPLFDLLARNRLSHRFADIYHS